MRLVQTLTLLVTTLTTGLMAGLFAAFAYSVMPGLGRSSDHTMVEAMQNINKAILNPTFMLLFMGSVPLLVLAAILAWRQSGHTALWLILAALVLYLVAFAITSGVNVPLNDQLANAGNPSHLTNIAQVREHFEHQWVTWNIARALLHTAVFACLALALISHGAHRPRTAALPALTVQYTGHGADPATRSAQPLAHGPSPAPAPAMPPHGRTR